MKKRPRYLALLTLSTLIFAALACGGGATAPTTTHVSDTSPHTPVPEPTNTPIPAEATAPADTPTPPPTSEPKPTETPGPTNTPGPSGCNDNSKFVADVTVPDNTLIAPGETFTKVWRIQNNGSCTWKTSYQFVFVSGEQMGAPQSAHLTQDVPPGATYDVSVNFTAPTTPGTYRSIWQLRTPDGALFGIQPYVQIVVPTPTHTPTPTEEPEEIAGLSDELYFSPGGGGGGGCMACPLGADLLDGYSDCICLFGFHFDEKITVDLYMPNGDTYSAVFRVEEGADGNTLVRTHPPMEDASLGSGWAWEEDGVNRILIQLWGAEWGAVNLPAGEWYAVAYSDSTSAEGLFEVKTPDQPVIGVIPDTGANPLQGERSRGYHDLCDGNSYSAGELVQIVGINLPPNRDLPLGIYYRVEPVGEAGRLVYSQMVKTDSQGNFQIFIGIEPSDPAGYYHVIVVTDPNSEYVNSHYYDGYEFSGAESCFRVSNLRHLVTDAIRDYYSAINNRQYEIAWARLSNHFKGKFNCCTQDGQYDFDGYLTWWNSVEHVNIGEVRVVEQNDGTAMVFAQLSYLLKDGRTINDSKPYIQLVLDATTNTWLFYDKW